MSMKTAYAGLRGRAPVLSMGTRFLQFSALFPLALAIVIGFSLSLKIQREDRVARHLDDVYELMDTASRLIDDSRAYAASGSNVAVEEWQNRYVLLGSTLNAFSLGKSSDSIAETMWSNYRQSQVLFSRLVQRMSEQKARTTSSARPVSAAEDIAMQLTRTIGTIPVNAFRLAQSANAKAAEKAGRVDTYIFLFTAVLAIAMSIFAYVAVREEMAARDRMRNELRRNDVELSDVTVRLRRAGEQAFEHERLRNVEESARRLIREGDDLLTQINASSESLRRLPAGTPVGPEVAGHAGVIGKSTEQLNGIVRGLAKHLPASRGKEPIAVNDLLKEVVESTRTVWERPEWNRIQVHLEPDNQMPLVNGYRKDLLDALTNLIRNAVEAMPKSGELTLRSAADKNAVAIEIADTGIGMHEATKTRCLEPFFSTKGSQHAGMGLTVAEAAVIRHGGTLSVQSEAGKGTSVVLTLPLKTASTSAAATTFPAPAQPGTTGNLRVLVVDDEHWSRELVIRHLRDSGHAIVSASNGHDALDEFGTGRFDLVITDHAMPDMTGEELIVAIRKIKPDQPIVMASGRSPGGAGTRVRPGSANATLLKPVNADELKAVIATVMTGKTNA